MFDVLLDSLIDSLKLLPFLLVVFVFLEYIEHKANNKVLKMVSKSKGTGPLIGSILGALPQCGLSVMATNLYITRIISIGTLIAIYLSTSDEMIPVLLSGGISFLEVLKIILVKIVVGLIFGYIIDFIIFRKKKSRPVEIDALCDEEHCHCDEHNFVVSGIEHTFKTFIFILLVNIVLSLIIYFIGNDTLKTFISYSKVFGPIFSSLVGLIPNCGASVVITELYVQKVISFGTMISGLLTGSGVAILILFKNNKNLKENLMILISLFLIGSIIGLLFNIIL